MAKMQISDSDRLACLAYLYQGKEPKEIPELLPGVSYAQALRLKKELIQAEEDKTVGELFSLSDAARDILLEQTKNLINAKGITVEGVVLTADELIDELQDDIQATKILKAELAQAGTEVVRKIKLLAKSTNSSEVLLNLAEALAKMQASYFRTASVTLNPGEGFADFLQKP